MLQRFSEQFTDFLLFKGIIQYENREIYTYGFVALFSTLINMIIMITIGIAAGMFLDTVLFMFMFGVLRVYCGGYHAKSHISCVLIFIALYGFAMSIAKFLPTEIMGYFSLSAGIFSFLIILFLAPIEHKNKPFIEDEERKFRMMSRVVASMELMTICIISIFFSNVLKAAVLISLAMLCVTFTLILAKAKEIRR